MRKDCMDTKTFFKERQRMCDYHSHAPIEDYCRSENGALCPLHDGELINCNDLLWDNSEGAIRIVQKWSDDHPDETIEQYFNKILPRLNFDYYSNLCCVNLDDRIKEPKDGCNCDEASCRACWNRSYKESTE